MEKPPAYQDSGNFPQQPPPATAYPASPAGQIGEGPPTSQAWGPPPPQTQQQMVYMSPAVNPCCTSIHPIQIICPHCQQQVTTKIVYENGALTWIIFLVLLFVFFCAACIPFCIDDVKDVYHYCPNCNRHIGTKRRL